MITVTEKAAKKAKAHLLKRGKGIGILVGVKTTGCSGLSYVLEFVDKEPDPEQTQMFESYGVKIFVDVRHLPYLTGMVMDWKREGLNEGFDFQNPNVKNECGCGESFTV